MSILSVSEQRRLLSALAELEPGQRLPKDGRKHKRWGVIQWLWVCRLARDPGHRPQIIKVLLRDVSAGGMGFFSRRPMKRGEFVVAPLHYAEGGGRLVLARLTFSKSVGKRHWIMGAQFVEHIDDPELRAPIPAEWYEKAIWLGHK